MARASLCVLLGGVLLSGCVSSFGGMFGKSAQPVETATGAQGVVDIAEFIGTNPSGNTAAVRNPGTGTQAQLRVEGEYLAGTGETCRKASIVNQDDKSQRVITACRDKGGWTIVPEILSTSGGR